MRKVGGGEVFVKADKEEIKKKILANYCFAKPDSKLALILDRVGIEVAIQLVDLFQGQALSLPSRSSLQRAALPLIIREDLYGLKPESEIFESKVKNLSKFYKVTKSAIIAMNETGKYTR